MKNYVYNFVYEGGQKFTFLLLVIVISILDKSISGSVLTAFAITNVCWLVIDLGSGVNGQKLTAQAGSLGLTGNVVNDIVAARMLLLVPALLLLWLICVAGYQIESVVVIGFGGYLIFKSFYLDWYYKGNNRFRHLALIGTASSIGVVVFMVLLYAKFIDFVYASFGWLLYSLIFSVLLITWSGKRLQPLRLIQSMGRSLGQIKNNASFAYSNIVTMLVQQSPVLIVSALEGAESSSDYSLTHRLVLSSLIIYQIYGTLIFTRFSKQSTDSSGLAVKSAGRILIVVLCVAVTLSTIFFLGMWFFSVEYGYLDSEVLVLVLFCVFLVFRSSRVVLSRLYLSISKQHWYAKMLFLTSLLYAFIIMLLYLNELLNALNVTGLFLAFEFVVFVVTLKKYYRLRREGIMV